MRIGELDDSVGKELLARREAVGNDLSRLGERLAEPGHGAVKPAAAVADSVRISAEARAAGFSRHMGEPPVALPSPAELVAALEQAVTAGGTGRGRTAERLGEVVKQLAAAFPGGLPASEPWPAASAAAALVRAVLSPPVVPDRVVALVRELVALYPTATGDGRAASGPTPFERAAVAILVAAAPAGPGVPAQAGVMARTESQFPAALYGLLGGAQVERRKQGREKLSKGTRRQPGGREDDEGSGYRPRPDSRRT